MKNKKIIIFYVLILSLCFGISSVKAKEVKWCDSDTLKEDSVAKYALSFSSNYELKNDDLERGSYIANSNGTYTMYYVYHTAKGYQRIEYDDNRGRQVRYPDSSNNITLDVVFNADENEVAFESYPNNTMTEPFDKSGFSDLGSVCNINKIAPGADTEGENALFTLSTSLPDVSRDVDDSGPGVPGGDGKDKAWDIDALNNSHKKNRKLYCQFDKNSNSHSFDYYTEEDYGKDKYFKIQCKETVTIMFDKPKATYAGGGFKYTVATNIKRSCKIIRQKTPKKRKKCTPSFYFTDHHTTNGGPNEKFNNCINQCDGGEYTSKCSKACYAKVYEKKKVNINKISFEESDAKTVQKLMLTPGSVESSDTSNDPWCSVNDWNHPPKSRSYRAVSKNKNNAGAWWWVVCPSAATKDKGQTEPLKVKNGPNRKNIPNSDLEDNKNGIVYGCVYGFQSNICSGTMVCNNSCGKDTVETKGQQNYYYEKDLASYYSQLKGALEYVGVTNVNEKEFTAFGDELSPTKPEDADVTTDEHYIKNDNISRTTYYNKDNQAKSVGLQYDDVKGDKATYKYINYKHAYIKLNDGSVTYDNKNKNTDYIFGGYLFYTDINTTFDDTNDIRYYPDNRETFQVDEVPLTGYKEGSKLGSKEIKWNISTLLKNIGSQGQWNIDVECFYGATLGACCPDGKCECDCEGNKCRDIGGLPYIYRTVDLENMFPERNPAYNWRSNEDNVANAKASTKEYPIDAQALADDIRSKGTTIYSGNPYVTLEFNDANSWDKARSNELYSKFNGSYTKSSNGISFYISNDFIENNERNKSNRTN